MHAVCECPLASSHAALPMERTSALAAGMGRRPRLASPTLINMPGILLAGGAGLYEVGGAALAGGPGGGSGGSHPAGPRKSSPFLLHLGSSGAGRLVWGPLHAWSLESVVLGRTYAGLGQAGR